MNFKFIPVLLIVLSVTYSKAQNPILQTKFTADPPDHSRDALPPGNTLPVII